MVCNRYPVGDPVPSPGRRGAILAAACRIAAYLKDMERRRGNARFLCDERPLCGAYLPSAIRRAGCGFVLARLANPRIANRRELRLGASPLSDCSNWRPRQFPLL